MKQSRSKNPLESVALAQPQTGLVAVFGGCDGFSSRRKRRLPGHRSIADHPMNSWVILN